MGKCMFLRKGEVHTEPFHISAVLNDNDWETIRKASDAGIASNYFAVGDTKTITINGNIGNTYCVCSNLSVDAFIIGIDHNSVFEGANRIHFQIGKINGVDVCLNANNWGSVSGASGSFVMDTSNTNSGGWESSNMRKAVLGSDSTPDSPTANTLLAALPSDLRAVMKPIAKYSDNTGGTSNTASYVTVTTDYLPLLSEWEVHGARTRANSAEQNYQCQYDYYAAGNSKIKYGHNAQDTSIDWWNRSVAVDFTYAFCLCAGGSASFNDAYMVDGVAPAFAV